MFFTVIPRLIIQKQLVVIGLFSAALKALYSVSGTGCDLHSWAFRFPCCHDGESNSPSSCMTDKLSEFSREMGPNDIDKGPDSIGKKIT